MLKRIPYLVYALIAIVISTYLGNELVNWLIKQKWLTASEGEAKVAIFSTIYTVLGLLVVVIQLQSQKQNDIIATEYLNQPSFEFLEPLRDSDNELQSLINHSPTVCFKDDLPNPNKCYSEHWFIVRQTGNLAAHDLKISMFHEEELDIRIPSRIIKVDNLAKNDLVEYKIPPFSIESKYFDLEKNSSFNVLISYKSQYSNIRYKKLFCLEYTPQETKNDLSKGYWLDSVYFFSVKNCKTHDDYSITSKQYLVGKILKYLTKTGIRPYFSPTDWVISF